MTVLKCPIQVCNVSELIQLPPHKCSFTPEHYNQKTTTFLTGVIPASFHRACAIIWREEKEKKVPHPLPLYYVLRRQPEFWMQVVNLVFIYILKQNISACDVKVLMLTVTLLFYFCSALTCLFQSASFCEMCALGKGEPRIFSTLKWFITVYEKNGRTQWYCIIFICCHLFSWCTFSSIFPFSFFWVRI